jgi:hypothetical protein
LTEEGRQTWLAKVAEENPEEAEFVEVKERPEEAEHQPWHILYWRAWDALMYDRQFGAMGGQSGIPYTALARYADDNGIVGEDLHIFLRFMRGIDQEYLEEEARKAAAAEAAKKR